MGPEVKAGKKDFEQGKGSCLLRQNYYLSLGNERKESLPWSIKKTYFLCCAFLLVVSLFASGWVEQTQAQPKYPVRPIDLIIPMAAGGSTDLAGRVIAAYLHNKWNVPVNAINKPGGNCVPGSLEVFNAAPDGYTLLMDGQSSSSQMLVAVRKLPFNLMDRTFIATTFGSVFMVIVNPSSPFKSLKDLETEAKRDPENFTWTSLGGSGGQDYVGRQFFKIIGVDIRKTKPVMAKGGSEAVVLTAGGHVKMGSGTVSSCLPGIRGGTLRPLAVTSRTRWPDLPDVPTTAEVGYPALNALPWYCISGPPNLPAHVVDIWDKALQEMVKDPEIITKMRNVGAIAYYLDSSATKEFLKKEIEEMEVLWGVK